MKNCKECNKLFETNGTSKRYCSDKCHRVTINRRKLKKYHNNKTPIIKECKNCGKEIKVRGNQQYCSDFCKTGIDGKFYVYILPEVNYAGMTKDVKSRIQKHRKTKGITNYQVVGSYDCPKKAHLHETQLHVDGYDGFYVEMSYF